MEGMFEQRFPGIDLELVAGTATAMLRKISDEHTAGVRYFDVHIGGAASMISAVSLEDRLLIRSNLICILPEVKDA